MPLQDIIDYELYNSEKHSGLVNLVQSCYMSTALQCLSFCPYFVKDFFKDLSKYMADFVKNQKDSSVSLIFQLANVLVNIKILGDSYYSPTAFQEALVKTCPWFRKGVASDMSTVVRDLISNGNRVLNTISPNKEVESFNHKYINFTNQKDAFDNFRKYSYNDSHSFSNFYYIKTQTTKCPEYNNVIYNTSQDFILDFPLAKVCNYVNKTENDKITIDDFFAYFLATDYLESWYCQKCNKNVNATETNHIDYSPKCLIVYLNSGKNKTLNRKKEVPKFIDLSDIVNKKKAIYRLGSFSCHVGESSSTGHYLAYGQDKISQNWKKCNDSIVNEVEDKEIDSILNNEKKTKEGLDYDVCMLFYIEMTD